MFTGLIQATGRVASMRAVGSGRRVGVALDGLSRPTPSGASVAVNGVCLTVTERRGNVGYFDVSPETARRSTFAAMREGAVVNLEPALRMGDPLDGHWVLGHVDATVRVVGFRDDHGGIAGRFEMPDAVAGWIAEKGSVALDGISLTVSALGDGWFDTALIPETMARTTLGHRAPGDRVNLEVDPLARYATRWLAWNASSGGRRGGGDSSTDAAATPSVDESLLRAAGFIR